MTDTTTDLLPRPIRRRRMECLLIGLQRRFSSAAQNLAAEVQRCHEELQLVEAECQQQLKQIDMASLNQSEETITQWDESRLSCWDVQEGRGYQAAFQAQARECQLVSKSKKEAEQCQADAKTKVAELENRMLASIEKTGQKLDQFRQQLAQVKRATMMLEQAASTALAAHSLSAPDQLQQLPVQVPTESRAAQQLAEASLRVAQQHVRKLENLPLAKFFSSYAWWAICALVFVGTLAGLIGLSRLGPLFALPVAAATTLMVVLLSFFGVRPWLKRAVAAEYPKLRGQLHLALTYHDRAEELVVAENDAELKRLAAKRDSRFEEIKNSLNSQLSQLKQRLEKEIADYKATAEVEKRSAVQELATGLRDIDSRFQQRVQQESLATQEFRRQTVASAKYRQDEILQQIGLLERSGTARLHHSTQNVSRFIGQHQRWCAERFPVWDCLHTPDLTQTRLSELAELPVGKVVVGQVVGDLKQHTLGGLEMPLLFSPLNDHYLVVSGRPGQIDVKQFLRSFLLRALTSLPAGRVQLCVIDPPGLGRDFGWLMHLSDFDPQLVSHRVWTQSSHIARQLQNLSSSAEDFIQQSLRNQYGNISDYNRQAGALAEPFRILVWSSFPQGLDELSWKNLQSLLDSGSRCGIISVLVVDPAEGDKDPRVQSLKRSGMHISIGSDGHFSSSSQQLPTLAFQPEDCPPDALTDQIIDSVGRRALAAQRVEVPLANIATVEQSQRWLADSSKCLEIPIGQSGVGRTHAMKLGVGTAQHAIIAGKTGSGKSSLLHALITSALLKYSPDNLRLVLLDFKKGVEFQVYADSKIPHADIIGIESHREFGLSALEYLDGCLQRRGELFRSAGVQDIASWNAAHPDRKMPRVLLVIDEFQELFVEDDRLSQGASLILDRIVRQGRSFGIHAVLSSQTLAGAYSLQRTTLGQMAVRVALQCDEADAQIIFADDNPVAARLKHPGQAVYNDMGGRIEGNQPMQIGWLDKSSQLAWFEGMPKGYQNEDATTNRLGRSIVFDGNRPATWQPEQAEIAIDAAMRNVNQQALWCAVGDSVAISPAVVFPLTQQAGRNVLVVGSDDNLASSVIDLVTHCFMRAAVTAGQQSELFCIQAARPTDTSALALPKRWQDLQCRTHGFDARGAVQAVNQVHEMLQQRMAAPDSHFTPVLAVVLQLGRLRELRREEEFSFGTSESTADKKLEEILRDGPSYRIHSVIWADSFSTVNRWLSRVALRELEVRLLMQMSDHDSSNLVDSLAAAKLGDYVMLLHDEATGQQEKFRPYSWPSLVELTSWVNAYKIQ